MAPPARYADQQMPRATWCFWHCWQRLGEHYRLGLTVGEYRTLCQKLAAEAKADSYAHSHRRREVHRVWHRGRQCTAVFDRRAQLVVTILPPSAYHVTPRDHHACHRDHKRAKARKRRAPY